MPTIQRALISVSDKRAIIEFATALHQAGVELLSTGGTARSLAAAGLPVIEVSDYTGFPEMLDGRVKTLHPKVHGGILARRELGTHQEAMARHGIPPIDLVVVNLYPFEQTVAREGCTLEEAIENIDIGGPSLLRGAAKNHAHVTVVVDASDYDAVLADMRANGGATTDRLRFRLAVKAYEHTARYDAAISGWLGSVNEDGTRERFPRTLQPAFDRSMTLRYGENPHQAAAFYVDAGVTAPCIATARMLQGKELSYNNIADADAALECVRQFENPACVIVKHANPCGVAETADTFSAYDAAYATDPVSAFGGIIALNRPLDATTAAEILKRQFVEVILAPRVDEAALPVLAAKSNIRVLETGDWRGTHVTGWDFKRVTGGLLVQDRDEGRIGPQDLKVVTRRAPTDAELRDLLFSWKIVKFVKSNAIVYCRDLRTVGVGAGQMSRVYSARIAAIKAQDAGLEVRGSVMASDAFFPFRDGLDQAAEVGITAVIQPGGSMRDAEVIQAADEHGIAMVFTGMRHFRH